MFGRSVALASVAVAALAGCAASTSTTTASSVRPSSSPSPSPAPTGQTTGGVVATSSASTTVPDVATTRPPAPSTTTSTPPTTAGTTQPGPATTTAAPSDTLTITGGLTLSLTESDSTNSECTKQGSTLSGLIAFQTTDFKQYRLQVSLSAGTTTLPAAKPGGLIALFDPNDATAEWSAGTTLSKGVTGAITISDDLSHGTIDTDMDPEPGKPNPSLTPIHLHGTFTCPT